MSPSDLNMRRWVSAPADGRSGAEGPGPAIVGYIDKIDGARVSGWAWDRSQPDLALDIEIRIGDRVVATVRADRLRKDLARSGTGNGYHAFEAVLDAPVADGERALVNALARVVDQPPVPLVNRAVEPPTIEIKAATPPTELRRWLDDLGAIQRAFEQTLKVAAQDIREAVRGRGAVATAGPPSGDPGAIDELRSRQEELARQIAALEVFHARFDSVLRSLEKPRTTEEMPEGESNRGLRIAVIGVAALSAVSLLLGLYSVLG
jgi:hypothetical protein